MPVNTKFCSIFHRLAAIWRGGTPIRGFGELVGELGGRELRQSKANQDFPIPLNTKFPSICRRLAANPMSSFEPPIWPLHLGGGVPIEISSPQSYSTYIYTIGLSCTILQAADDRQIGKGCLCYSIGDPIITASFIHHGSFNSSVLFFLSVCRCMSKIGDTSEGHISETKCKQIRIDSLVQLFNKRLAKIWPLKCAVN